MKLLGLLFLFGFNSAAAPITVERLVMADIQALLDDTVNEGDQTARALHAACEISNARQGSRKWALCRVDFTVVYEGASTERACNLLYSFKSNDLEADFKRGPRRYFDVCLENLSDSLE